MTRRWPWALWGLTVLLIVATFRLAALNDSFSEDPFFLSVAIVMIVGYTTLGALIATRTDRNPIGWLLMLIGAGFLLGGFTDEYLRYAFLAAPTGCLRRPLRVAHELGVRVRRVPDPLDPLALPGREAAHPSMAAGRDRDPGPGGVPVHRPDPQPGTDRRRLPRAAPHEPDGHPRARGLPRRRASDRRLRPARARACPRSPR